MAQKIQSYFNYLRPVPPLDNDEAVLAYQAAYDAWYVDRAGENAWDRITMIESEPEHVAVMARAAELSS